MKIKVTKDIEVDLSEVSCVPVSMALLNEQVNFNIVKDKIILSLRELEKKNDEWVWNHYLIKNGEAIKFEGWTIPNIKE